jgi:gas vesicle protein
MSNFTNVACGLLTGVAIGATLGILLAPASGRETRRRIVDGSLKMREDLRSQLNESLETTRQNINERIDLVAGGGKKVVNETTDKLKG